MAVDSVSSIEAQRDMYNLQLPCNINDDANIEISNINFPSFDLDEYSTISKSVDICEETVNPPGEKVTSHDFDLLKKLGKGGYGQVYLAKKVYGVMVGEYFAMKVVKKARLITNKKNDTKYAMTERNILEAVNHPFLVKLYFAFQTNHSLFLVLEYLAGGELFMQLERQHTLTEDEARFYLAEITLALGHLHLIGVIYRDLKSENVMLDRYGHVKLTDFGLSKERNNNELTHSFCGTVEYMAPEILQRRGHGQSVDWWSMGILLYDMLIGSSPFTGGNRSQVIHKVINGKLKIPRFLSDSGKHLLKNLLNKNPKTRLGGGDKDVEEIKKHYFFKTLNWDSVYKRQLTPPFIPKLSGQDDVSLFDKDIVSEPCLISPTATTDETNCFWFENFSYVSPQIYLELAEQTSYSRQRSRSGLSHSSSSPGESQYNQITQFLFEEDFVDLH